MKPSKEIRVEVRLRNNILYNAIFDNWNSVAAFCRDKGFQDQVIGKLLNLKLSPIHKRTGEYKQVCQRLSKCFGILVEDLFPLYIYNLEKQELAREISIAEIGWREVKQISFFEDPLEGIEEKERTKAIEEVLEELTPRQREMLKMHFGLANYSEQTYEEIGKTFGVVRAQVGQIIKKAIRTLQHPKRVKILEKHL